MKTLDRYIVKNLLVSAVMCLAAIVLLRVAADLFFNLDEFAESKTSGSGKTFGVMIGEICSYYAFQSLVYFRQLGGVIIVLAATFTLWRMNHTNELTAILASGVSLHRVLLPIVVCAIALNLLVIVDTELLIPPVKQQLVRKRDDVAGARTFQVRVVVDNKRSAWYSSSFDPVEGRLDKPLIFLRDDRMAFIGHFTGPSAIFDRSKKGWVFTSAPPAGPKEKPIHAVMRIKDWAASPTTGWIPTTVGPDKIIEQARAKKKNKNVDWLRVKGINGISIRDNSVGLIINARRLTLKVTDGKVIGTVLHDAYFNYYRRNESNKHKPVEHRPDEMLAYFSAGEAVYDGKNRRWTLTDGRMVYSCDLNPSNLALRQSGNWMEYMSTAELTRLLRLKRVPDARGATLVRHTRFADFFNNIILLLVAVPFILSRERNIKVSAGLALLMVGGTFAFIFVSRYIGLPPAIAAWLPILVFGPISAAMLDSIKT